MACTIEFIEHICAQIEAVGCIRYRKMFGEYMIYANDKPIILACDDTAYVKMLPELTEFMQDAETGFPYPGAKEHYILDVDRRTHATRIARILEAITPLPKPKTKKSKS